MRLWLKRFLYIFAFISFAWFHPSAYAAEREVSLVVNGQRLSDLPMPPTLFTDAQNEMRVLIPAREVFEAMGAAVDWVGEQKMVLITYDNHLLILVIDSRVAWLDGAEMEMSIGPKLINDKTMIPLRFPAECFNFEVDWEQESYTAYVSSPSGPERPPTGQLPDTPPDLIPEPIVILPPGSSQDAAVDVSTQEMTRAQYPETAVTMLLTPLETQNQAYIITASSPITEVQKFLLPDNRLVIDIYNAKCAISGTYPADETTPVNAVRASQFMTTPMVTRVVFEVAGAAEYSVSMSGDRASLTVSFMRNVVNDIAFSTVGLADTLTVRGIHAPIVNIYPAAGRFIINIENAELTAPAPGRVNGAFIHNITAAQQSGGSVRLEAEFGAVSSYSITRSGNSVSVMFHPSTHYNISYDFAKRSVVIPKASGLVMNISEITHTDDYLRNRYILSLPVNAEFALGYGEMFVYDAYLQSVIISRDARGLTQLVLNETRVLAFAVGEDSENYYIEAKLPREVYRYIICVDPGHGGSQPGTSNGTHQEKTINLSVALKLMQLFEADPSIKAYATRLTDAYVELAERPIFANAFADMFVSVHANAMTNNNTINGIETWYFPHSNDGALGLSSMRLGEIIQARLINATGAVNRGVKAETFKVLTDTVIPAVLVETGFMTNPQEAAKLADEQYQWLLARAIYDGVRETFEYYTPAR